jgi:hypothetical protein
MSGEPETSPSGRPGGMREAGIYDGNGQPIYSTSADGGPGYFTQASGLTQAA